MRFRVAKAATVTALAVAVATLAAPPAQAVLGGVPAKAGDFPAMLSLEDGGEHVCGATLVAPDRALTAAHCVWQLNPRRFAVRAGSLDRGKGGERVEVKYIGTALEASFEPLIKDDLAVLVLRTPFTTVKPAPMAKAGDKIPAGTPVTTFGWGPTSLDGGPSDTLQRAELVITPDRDCEGRGTNVAPGPWQICAAPPGDKPVTATRGDSGGPLVSDGILIGITSSMHANGIGYDPTHFTRVSHFTGESWFKVMMGTGS